MSRSKQFIVIGLGRFGSSVASTLYHSGFEVLAVDNDPDRVQMFSDQVTHVLQADSTDEDTLLAIGVRNFDVAVVAIGDNLQANMLTTLQLKELGVKYIVAKAQNAMHGKMLEKIGADRVVYPERDMGQRVAHNLASSNIMDYIELSPNLSLVEVSAPKKMIGLSLIEVDLRAKYEVNVVAIKRGDEIIVPPNPNEKIQDHDILIIVGSSKGAQKIEEMA